MQQFTLQTGDLHSIDQRIDTLPSWLGYYYLLRNTQTLVFWSVFNVLYTLIVLKVKFFSVLPMLLWDGCLSDFDVDKILSLRILKVLFHQNMIMSLMFTSCGSSILSPWLSLLAVMLIHSSAWQFWRRFTFCDGIDGWLPRLFMD